MRKVNSLTTLAGLALTAAMANAAVTVTSHHRLGEDDAGAANGAIANDPTTALVGSDLARAGDPVYNTTNTAPGSSFAVDFDGAGDGFSVGTPANTATDNFGIEAWAYADSTNSPVAIVHNGQAFGNGAGLWQFNGNWGVLFAGLAVFDTGVPVTTGTWNHIAFVRDGGVGTFYLNGAVAAGNNTAPNPAVGNFSIGMNQSGAENFDGLIDNVRTFTFNPGEFEVSDLSYPIIPEPGSLALLGLGGLALIRRRRR